MKLITAIIQPSKLDDLRAAAKAAGVSGMTVSEVQGFGRQAGVTEVYRGAEYTTAFIPKIKAEIIADDADVASILDVILGATQTGKIGDGKVWIAPLDDVVRIRTGETGGEALS